MELIARKLLRRGFTLVELLVATEDGSSQTIMVGERAFDRLPATWPGVVGSGELAIQRVVGSASHPPNASAHPEDFGSRHVGGTHFVLADGSARFISDNIDLPTYSRLGTISGGEVVGEF